MAALAIPVALHLLFVMSLTDLLRVFPCFLQVLNYSSVGGVFSLSLVHWHPSLVCASLAEHHGQYNRTGIPTAYCESCMAVLDNENGLQRKAAGPMVNIESATSWLGNRGQVLASLWTSETSSVGAFHASASTDELP